MIPKYYEFFNPVKILSGHKALDNIPYELEQLGVKKPLIITDKGIKKAGLLKYVKRAFAESNTIIGSIYDDVPSDSSLETVYEIVKIFKDNSCDSIIAVGGGSVIDTAKGVNILITEDSNDLMKFAGAEILKKPMKPLIVIPTTSGTGSEVTLVAVISDEKNNTKMAFTSLHLLPRVAILDTRMTLTLPAHITAATGMDALTHAIEAYTCIQKNPISDAHAWMAIKLISENLIKAVKKGKDKKARLALLNASCMAGAAFSNSMVGMVHSLGHATGAICHIHHGVAMNIFLPYVLEYNLIKIREYISELLFPLAGNEIYSKTSEGQRAEKVIEYINNLRDELYKLTKLPRTLKEAGISKEKIPEIAKLAIGDGSLTFNPVDMDYEDAIKILNKAYK